MKVNPDPLKSQISPATTTDTVDLRNPTPLPTFRQRVGFQTSILHTQVSAVLASSFIQKLEKYSIAFLSISDMVTDIIMTTRYFERGQTVFAFASLICLSFNLILLVLTTGVVYKKSSWGKIIREELIVFSLIKPAVDAHRVAVKQPQEAGVIMDANAELTVGRVIEMVMESIPGTVIQLTSIAVNRDYSKTAMLSLASSITTTAFISAQVSYEWDIMKEKRKRDPRFYGCVPKRMRQKVMVTIMLLLVSMFCLVIRASSCVLLGMRGGHALVGIVLGGEWILYAVYKLARKDFEYWLPIYGPVGVLIAFFARSMIKFAGDWAGVVQFRHPGETGGAYFTLTLCCTIAIGIASAVGYRREDNMGEGGEDNGQEEEDEFSLCLDDEFKLTIFSYSENKWRPAIGDDVKEWLGDSVQRWLDKKVLWFNDLKKSQIPTWAIDDPFILGRIRNKNVMKFRREKEKVALGTVRPDR
ncbi:hypothetical protein TL16_g04214 [Triparma laevis f. inornata]|uniref:Uncharacterized protein n=1 Tax=Triparma laevis f. inornata TaxID=1714386 RepID=A0A9W7A9Q4_9STRA|nr:hypothetical protein TL16_g04214 [Triparma laevis f. inornata]